MGRIEEALRRATEHETAIDEDPVRSKEPVDTPFVSAWQLDATSSRPGLRRQSPPQAVNRKVAPRIQTAPMSAASPSGAAPSVRLESQLALNWPQPFAVEVAEKLVLMPSTDPDAVAQYRKLAGALQRTQLERPVKTVLVAGAAAGEGTTLTAMNLALTLSEQCASRVLLVDANLQEPRLHQLFQVSAGAGLSHALKSSSERRLPIVEVTGRLAILPAGRPDADSVGLLGSDRMADLLKEASAAFEWIILDSPALSVTPEANQLAKRVDATVLVIAAGRTPRKVVEDAVDALGRDRLVGVVLNRGKNAP
jgi:capsular exopolysaccharide synthesis family protein